MKDMIVTSIGTIEISDGETHVVLKKIYIPALKGLEGFSHLGILWWFSDFDTLHFRQNLLTLIPYKSVRHDMGVFATRSPQRPNPVALTTARILHIEYRLGRILVSYVDANNMSPVIDLKPYTPSLDRVENPSVPQWCANWPGSLEESESFDWEKEFEQP